MGIPRFKLFFEIYYLPSRYQFICLFYAIFLCNLLDTSFIKILLTSIKIKGSSPRTVNTTVSTPNYCCLLCLQKHGSIQKKWGGSVVQQVSHRTTRTQYIFTRSVLGSPNTSGRIRNVLPIIQATVLLRTV